MQTLRNIARSLPGCIVTVGMFAFSATSTTPYLRSVFVALGVVSFLFTLALLESD